MLLTDHHHRLEERCRDMLGWTYADDARHLTAAWSELEAELLEHMMAEEEVLLPTYVMHDPEDARAILDDHARIRLLVTPIGVDVELHEVRAERLRKLVDALDAHSAREDAAMYRWAASNLGLVAQGLLINRVGHWLDLRV